MRSSVLRVWVAACGILGVGLSGPLAQTAPEPEAGQVPPAAEPVAGPPAESPEGTGPAPAPPPKRGTPIEATYEDAFLLRTADHRHEMRLGASAHLDSRFHFGDAVSPHSFDIRRARLDVIARLFGDLMEMRIQAALEDNPYIRNAYLDIKVHEAFHVMAGQMKVPFSTLWLTFDNQVNFLERGTNRPFYPFFDRGVMVWGEVLRKTVTYNFGVYTGAGVDLDATRGDVDRFKDLAWRLFWQPFRNAGVPWLAGLYVAGNGTWGFMSRPTRRFETGGLSTANYESLVWRWRSEQVFGDNGRNRDVLAATVGSRARFGAEAIYLNGPFTLAVEWDMVRYRDIAIFHDFWQGSKRLKHDPVMARDGDMHHVSVWASWFLTGEGKAVNNFGFKQPKPARAIGEGGYGAFEVLARFSATRTDPSLFDTKKVQAFPPADFVGADGKSSLAGPAPGEGASLNAAVLEGARRLYEVTLGLNWTLNAHARLQLNYLYLWDPEDGPSGIVSAGRSDLNDLLRKNRLIKSEHTLGVRLIFRI